MKVLCIRVPAPVDGMKLDSSPWVTLDRDYAVTAITADFGGRVQLQLLDDTNGLGWFDANCFLTLDASVPSNWIARLDDGGNLHLAPHDWLLDGFWERYYDGDAAARESVETELATILGKASS